MRRKIPKGRVSEVNLKEIAQQLTNDVWKKFARQVGVTDPEIQDIQVANRGDPEEQRYQMVRRWWEKSDSPDYSVLCYAAIGLQRLQLCDAFIRVARNSRTETPFEGDSNGELLSVYLMYCSSKLSGKSLHCFTVTVVSFRETKRPEEKRSQVRKGSTKRQILG